MMRWQTMLIWLYTQMLRLYPAAFYTQFADEMTDVYRQVLRKQTWQAGIREIALLGAAIIREHQHQNQQSRVLPLRRMLALLSLPVIAALVLLLVRPVTIFYLPGKVWLVFTGLCIVMLALGWLLERRITVLVLPMIGFLLFIAIRLFETPPLPGGNLPILLRITLPFIGLVAAGAAVFYSRRHKDRWVRWLLLLLALPVVAMVFSLMIIEVNWAINQPVGELIRGYVLGALLPIGYVALPVLVGLPLARWFGANTILLVIGFLFLDVFGLSASLPNADAQRLMGGFFVLLFLLVIPVLRLRATGRCAEHLSVMLPVAIGYVVFFVMQGATEDLLATFVLYRSNELVLTLIMLYLAGEIFPQVPPHTAKQPTPQPDTQPEPVKL